MWGKEDSTSCNKINVQGCTFNKFTSKEIKFSKGKQLKTHIPLGTNEANLFTKIKNYFANYSNTRKASFLNQFGWIDIPSLILSILKKIASSDKSLKSILRIIVEECSSKALISAFQALTGEITKNFFRFIVIAIFKVITPFWFGFLLFAIDWVIGWLISKIVDWVIGKIGNFFMD